MFSTTEKLEKYNREIRRELHRVHREVHTEIQFLSKLPYK